MGTQSKYPMNLEAKFGLLEWMDVQALAAACKETWYSQTLCRVNDCVVRQGIVHGEFHWHKHDEEDELFYVVEGRLLIDLEGRTVELLPKQGTTIPKGVVHRTRPPERTVTLVIEGAGVVATGN